MDVDDLLLVLNPRRARGVISHFFMGCKTNIEKYWGPGR